MTINHKIVSDLLRPPGFHSRYFRQQCKLGSIIMILALSSGCFPYYGRDRALPTDPAFFSNGQTGKHVQEVLILPEYVSMTGLGFGAGHGPTWGRVHGIFMAAPFIYHSGERFDLYGPRKIGIIWLLPVAAALTGSGFHTIVVVAPGYKTQCVDLYDHYNLDRFRLEPLSSEKAIQELRMIATLLKKNQLTETDQKFPVLTGKDLGCWGLSRPIKIRFSEKERQVVETYLSAALQRFEDGGE